MTAQHDDPAPMAFRGEHGERGPGTLLGRYAVVRVLNTGGMGTVYEARDRERDARVAIKVLHPRFALNATVRWRFLREPWIVEQVRHPNTVRMLDVGDHEGLPFLVMDLLEGENLAEYLLREHTVSVPLALSVILPIAGVLGAAHAAGIVHQDVTPANIFLTRSHTGALRPILLDFGIARRRDDVPVVDPAHWGDLGEVLGTLHYMSPEQLRSGHGVEPRSDQFALGVILYECLTGRRPFAGETPDALLDAMVAGGVSPPRVLLPALPEALDAVIRRMLRPEGAERFPTMEAAADAMRPEGVTGDDLDEGGESVTGTGPGDQTAPVP